MIVGFDDGKYLLVEKNQVINMKYVKENYGSADMMKVNINKKITFGEFLMNAAKGMGSSLFLYDAVSNNCQVFVMSLLKYNDLLTPQLTAFIMQDVKTVLSTSPSYTELIAKLTTEAAAKFDRLFNGAGKQRA